MSRMAGRHGAMLLEAEYRYVSYARDADPRPERRSETPMNSSEREISKQRLDHQERRLMIASRRIITDIADRLSHAVFEEQAGIISEHRVPDGRFHAHAGSASGDHEIAGVQCLEDCYPIRVLIKPTETGLVKKNVPRLRLEPIYNLRVPGISNQKSGLQFHPERALRLHIAAAKASAGLENPQDRRRKGPIFR